MEVTVVALPLGVPPRLAPIRVFLVLELLSGDKVAEWNLAAELIEGLLLVEALHVLAEPVRRDAGELALVAGEVELQVDDSVENPHKNQILTFSSNYFTTTSLKNPSLPHVLLEALLERAPECAQVALDVLLRPGTRRLLLPPPPGNDRQNLKVVN